MILHRVISEHDDNSGPERNGKEFFEKMNGGTTMDDAFSPLVSICIPTYNRAGMVGTAIKSALAQTYTNIEVLVVDNASSDSIEEVVASFQDPRVRFIKNPQNLGLFGNFNRCIELSKGKYIHILHSDDSVNPEFIRICISFFENNPNVAMTFTSAEVRTDNSSSIIKIFNNDVVFPAPEGFRQILIRRNIIVCPSVIVKREIYEKIGLFSPEYPFSADYYQWLKIARLYDIAYIADACVYYRQGVHSESFRLQFTSPAGYLDTQKIFIQIITDLGNEQQKYAAEINIALRIFIRDCLFAGFVRTDTMKIGSACTFWGIALGTSGLVKSQSFTDLFRKIEDFVVIQVAGILMQFPFVRKIVKKILHKQSAMY